MPHHKKYYPVDITEYIHWSVTSRGDRVKAALSNSDVNVMNLLSINQRMNRIHDRRNYYRPISLSGTFNDLLYWLAQYDSDNNQEHGKSRKSKMKEPSVIL
jgi:hypothetical protein